MLCAMEFDKALSSPIILEKSIKRQCLAVSLNPTGVLKMNSQRRQPASRLPRAEPDVEVIVHRGDLVRALDQISDLEFEAMTARKLWALACRSIGVACDEVRGGKGPRPTRSQASQISQVLAARRRRVKCALPAGRLVHPKSSFSLAQAQLALSLVGRYVDAGAVFAELDMLQRFVLDCGGRGPAEHCLVIAKAMIDGRAAADPGGPARK